MMFHPNKTYRIGDIEITKIEEMRMNVAQPSFLFPDSDTASVDASRYWITPSNMEADTGNLIQSIHAWLVRTKQHTILIDTGAGNDKERPTNPIFHRLSTPFLERLAAAGVRPEDVDHVLHTHLHVDHVGWNTRLVDGQWVPTFPNARHVFSRAEEAYYGSMDSHNPQNDHSLGVYEDSVGPVIASGQAERIDDSGGGYLDHFHFRPTKGHSIGHMSIEVRSQGEAGIFTGDLMHHPLQVAYPEWNSVFCEWPDDARASRRWLLETAARDDLLVFTSHFAESSVGRVRTDGQAFTWQYE